MQYTSNSYLVTWVVDFTVSSGIKGLLKCQIVLLKYLRFKFVKMNFEQIMNFLSDLTKKELFSNIIYDQYLKYRAMGQTDEELKSKYIMYWEDFKFLNNFRERVNSLVLNSALINTLEGKYAAIKQKVDSKL